LSLKETLKQVKLNESTFSMILGAIVIVVVGVLVFNYFRGLNANDTSTVSVTTEGTSDEVLATHTVVEGENLWSISIIYFDSGFNWTDIAEFNNIESPADIEKGQEIKIPKLKEAIAETKEKLSDETADSIKEGVRESVGNISKEIDDLKLEDKDVGVNLDSIKDEIDEVIADTSETKEQKESLNVSDNSESVGEITELAATAIATVTLTPTIEPTSAPTDVPKPVLLPEIKEGEDNALTGDTYTVETGDSLWIIAERAYGDGNKWVDIASANDLANPNIIHRGNNLVLPR